MSRGQVLVAVYHPEPDHLRRQIRSIAEQTLTDWTCEIAIDGVDPETENLLRSLTKGDARFRIHPFDENVGFYRNFERLVEMVSAEAHWVALSDQDDVWDPEKLAVLVGALQVDRVSLAMCQARLTDGSGSVLGSTDRRVVDAPSLLLDNQVTGSLAVFTSEVARCALPFPAPTESAYHDHWIGLIAATLGDYVVIDAELQSYVQHGQNVLGEDESAFTAEKVRRLLGGGPHQAYSRLVEQRWGWRQRMASELVRRLPDQVTSPELRAIATNSRKIVVVAAIGRSLRAGNVSWARAASLSMGCLLARGV